MAVDREHARDPGGDAADPKQPSLIVSCSRRGQAQDAGAILRNALDNSSPGLRRVDVGRIEPFFLELTGTEVFRSFVASGSPNGFVNNR
jgi:rhodanese-related sulfurtransferase